MDLKNSKTKENLKTAFTGEAMARCKYMYYAEKARAEGMEGLALAYEKASRNEQEHGKLWFERYHGILSKEENLKDAIAGETYESEDMYINFAKIAKEEGFNDIAMLFEHVAKIEEGLKICSLNFWIAVAKLMQNGNVLNADICITKQKRLKIVPYANNIE